MPVFRTAALAAMVTLFAACSPPAATTSTTAAPDPVAAVQNIYAHHLSAHPSAEDANLVPMTPTLLDMVKRSRAITDEEVLDADPVVDANDPAPPEALAISADAPPANGHVTVTARFTQRGEATTVHYDLVDSGGAWLVDNIRGGSGADMRATLTTELAAQATSTATKP